MSKTKELYAACNMAWCKAHAARTAIEKAEHMAEFQRLHKQIMAA